MFRWCFFFFFFLINKDLEETEEKDCFDASMAGFFFLRCILGLFCVLFLTAVNDYVHDCVLLRCVGQTCGIFPSLIDIVN